jgi:hypothetical protein
MDGSLTPMAMEHSESFSTTNFTLPLETTLFTTVPAFASGGPKKVSSGLLVLDV